MPDVELLTNEERAVLAQLGHCWDMLAGIVGDGPTRQADLDELAGHVHALQQAVRGQAAARAYPGVYRLLGAVRVSGEEG